FKSSLAMAWLPRTMADPISEASSRRFIVKLLSRVKGWSRSERSRANLEALYEVFMAAPYFLARAGKRRPWLVRRFAWRLEVFMSEGWRLFARRLGCHRTVI